LLAFFKLELFHNAAGMMGNQKPDVAETVADMPLTDVNPDLDLLRRMRAGDQAAMAALYQRHQNALYRFALLRSGSPDTAADIVQDIFIALIEGKLAFDPTRGALSSFLFGVARNFMLKRDDAQRRYVSNHNSANADEDGSWEHDIADQNPTPLETMLADQRAEGLRAALVKIAPHYRDVLILYEMHDMSYVEIANVCNIDIGTVRSRLSRARSKLISFLSPSTHTQHPDSPAALRTTAHATKER
jgi:RNA polymerase sigma-70 factor (ECF subfamily)